MPTVPWSGCALASSPAQCSEGLSHFLVTPARLYRACPWPCQERPLLGLSRGVRVTNHNITEKQMQITISPSLYHTLIIQSECAPFPTASRTFHVPRLPAITMGSFLLGTEAMGVNWKEGPW